MYLYNYSTYCTNRVLTRFDTPSTRLRVRFGYASSVLLKHQLRGEVRQYIDHVAHLNRIDSHHRLKEHTIPYVFRAPRHDSLVLLNQYETNSINIYDIYSYYFYLLLCHYSLFNNLAGYGFCYYGSLDLISVLLRTLFRRRRRQILSWRLRQILRHFLSFLYSKNSSQSSSNSAFYYLLSQLSLQLQLQLQILLIFI